MSELLTIALVLIGSLLGLGIGWLLAKIRYSTKLVLAEAEAQAALGNKQALVAEMESVAATVARQNSEDFLRLAEEKLGKFDTEAQTNHNLRKTEIETLFDPLARSLESLEKLNRELEKERIKAYSGMESQINSLGNRAELLGKEASNLSTALRKSSSVRGDWGEVALRNLLEMAGMTKNTDFIEQKGIEGGGIPDFVVRLPGDGAIPIDAKTTAKHYLESLDEQDPKARHSKIIEHSKAMRGRVNELTRKDYLSGVSGRAEFVVMFVPSEALISSAFEVDPKLHSDAMDRGVIIAGPGSMIALLKTAALYWQQVRFANEAKEVVETAREFYKRMAIWSEHFSKVGRDLKAATVTYNKSVGSWEKNVLPQGRALEKLEISTNLTKDLEVPQNVLEDPRSPTVIGVEE